MAFTADASGLPAEHLTLSYPMLSIIGGEMASFSASISYMMGTTSLGKQTLLYTAPPGSPVLGTATGTPLDLPALAPDSTLTVSGFFVFSITSVGGPPTEIKTFGVAPEPSSLALMATAALGTGPWAIARRGRRARRRGDAPPDVIAPGGARMRIRPFRRPAHPSRRNRRRSRGASRIRPPTPIRASVAGSGAVWNAPEAVDSVRPKSNASENGAPGDVHGWSFA